MPRRAPTDVAHAALTDHRIRARPDPVSLSITAPPEGITAWREPPGDLQQRDLGLAYLHLSTDSAARRFGEIGGTLLNGLPPSQQNGDAAVLAALADVALSQGRVADSISLFRRARALDPSSAEYALYLGIALKQNKDLAEARSQLEQAIHLDHSLQRAYLELSAIYVKEGRPDEAASILDQYLALDPESILLRLTKQSLTAGKK